MHHTWSVLNVFNSKRAWKNVTCKTISLKTLESFTKMFNSFSTHLFLCKNETFALCTYKTRESIRGNFFITTRPHFFCYIPIYSLQPAVVYPASLPSVTFYLLAVVNRMTVRNIFRDTSKKVWLAIGESVEYMVGKTKKNTWLAERHRSNNRASKWLLIFNPRLLTTKIRLERVWGVRKFDCGGSPYDCAAAVVWTKLTNFDAINL